MYAPPGGDARGALADARERSRERDRFLDVLGLARLGRRAVERVAERLGVRRALGGAHVAHGGAAAQQLVVVDPAGDRPVLVPLREALANDPDARVVRPVLVPVAARARRRVRAWRGGEAETRARGSSASSARARARELVAPRARALALEERDEPSREARGREGLRAHDLRASAWGGGSESFISPEAVWGNRGLRARHLERRDPVRVGALSAHARA